MSERKRELGRSGTPFQGAVCLTMLVPPQFLGATSPPIFYLCSSQLPPPFPMCSGNPRTWFMGEPSHLSRGLQAQRYCCSQCNRKFWTRAFYSGSECKPEARYWREALWAKVEGKAQHDKDQAQSPARAWGSPGAQTQITGRMKGWVGSRPAWPPEGLCWRQVRLSLTREPGLWVLCTAIEADLQN